MPRTFDQVEIGESFADSLTITEAHVVLAAGIFNDFAPLHVNAVDASESRFGQRVAHGTLVAAILAAGLARYFGEYATGYLEQNFRFTAPVFIGDTVTSSWSVVEKIAKPKLGGGIVELAGTCSTQTGSVAIEGTSKLIVGNPV